MTSFTAPLITDPRPLLATAVSTAGETIAAVQDGQLHDPTPCGTYDVHELLAHLLGVLDRLAVVGHGVEKPFARPEAFVPEDGDWDRMWLSFAAAATDAWRDDAALARPTMLPWAAESGHLALRTYVAEITVHTWDLAVATGQKPAWNADVLRVSLDVMRDILPAVGRVEMFEAIRATMPPDLRGGPHPYDPAVTVPSDAPLIDQLVAHVGRRPVSE